MRLCIVSKLIYAPHHNQNNDMPETKYLTIEPWVDCSLMVRKDRGFILSRVIPKTQKYYLIPPWLTLNVKR